MLTGAFKTFSTSEGMEGKFTSLNVMTPCQRS